MKFLLTILAITFSISLMAQKKTFDIATYSPPPGWVEESTESYISYSKQNGTNWGQLAVYKSTASKGDLESDLQNEWAAIVLALRTMENDEKTQPGKSNGWDVVSRTGTWKYNGAHITTILTVFSNGKNCISLLCNATSEQYLKEFLQMIKSIELVGAGSPSIIGLWGNYNIESAGVVNGMTMTTGGYFRKEYTFYNDGTYLYRAKDWSNYAKDIRFVYETGKYEIKGNQLTLTPARAKGDWWGKAANGRTTGWGNRVKPLTHRQEKITYMFEIKYLSGMENSYLYLRSNKPTERDGSHSNQANMQHEFSYGKRNTSEEPLIDNPPGFISLYNPWE